MDWRITKISMKEGRKEKDVNLKLLSYLVMPRIPMRLIELLYGLNIGLKDILDLKKNEEVQELMCMN